LRTVGETVLETERLILRELELEDVDDMAEVLSDPWTMRFYPHPFSREEVVAWVERWRSLYGERGFGLWGVVERGQTRLAGDTGLTVQNVDGEEIVEVGWHINRRVQGRGFATEAGRASVAHGFDIGLDRVIALVRPENVPSWRVAEKLGMRVWKETSHRGIPHRVYLIERDDWLRPQA
jgi:RimJ/RimL family protein N-acetyltransferase